MNIKIIGLIVVIIGVIGLVTLWPEKEVMDTESTSQTAAVEQGVLDIATTTPTTSTTTQASTTPKKVEPITLSIVKSLLLDANSEPRTTPITHVLVHFISNVSAKPENPYSIEDIIGIFKTTGLSSHYLIDRDGTIYWLTSEKRVAYHGGKGSLVKFPEYTDKINHYSIGIEIAAIGTKAEMAEFISADKYNALPKKDIGYTDAQYTALNGLLEEIYKRYPTTVKRDRDHIIGHDEYAPGRKHDPGSLFDWSKIGF